MRRHLGLVVAVCLACDQRVSVLTTEVRCQAHADCASGRICAPSGACVRVCNGPSDCPVGEACAAGTCARPPAPELHAIRGNAPHDAGVARNGLIVTGVGLLTASFALSDGASAVSLAVSSQADDRAEVLLPNDVRSGSYVLVATNAAGDDQADVTLELPELTGTALLERLNAPETLGTLAYERLPVGTSAGTVAPGDAVQLRVNGSCDSGAISGIDANGDVTCSMPLDGYGIMSQLNEAEGSVLAYARLPVGTTAGTVAPGDAVQLRVFGACTGGAIASIAADGGTACQPAPVGSCPGGAISAISSDGVLTCRALGGGSGTGVEVVDKSQDTTPSGAGTTERTVYSYLVPAGSLNGGAVYRTRLLWYYTNYDTGLKTVRVRLNDAPLALTTFSAATTNNVFLQLEVYLIGMVGLSRAVNVTTDLTVLEDPDQENGVGYPVTPRRGLSVSPSSFAFDTTVDQALTITFQMSNAAESWARRYVITERLP